MIWFKSRKQKDVEEDLNNISKSSKKGYVDREGNREFDFGWNGRKEYMWTQLVYWGFIAKP